MRVGGTSRRPGVQIIGVPEGEKVIEDIFLVLKKLEFADWKGTKFTSA